MINGWFMWFIIVWVFILLLSVSTGGFFMIRKFLKVLPMSDGKSKLDWQNYYVEASAHLWSEDSKAFLEELVQPVPKPFRDIARHTIAAKIGQIALESGTDSVTREHCIKGYIIATPKRDHKSLIAFLETKQIDYKPYEKLMQQ